MILPSKYLTTDKSLVGVAADISKLMSSDVTVSGLWELLCRERRKSGKEDVSFDWFVLALDLMFLMGLVEMRDGIVMRVAQC